MKATRDEAYHLLEVSRHNTTTAGKPLVGAMLGRKLIARLEKPNGGVFADKYRITEDGFEALLASPHFDAARLRLDAEMRDDECEDSQEMEL